MDEKMKSFVDVIVDAWLTTGNRSGQDVSAVFGAPSYAIRGMKQECSGAIPMETPCEIDEEFASVRLVTAKKALGGAGKDLLLLTYSGAMPPRSFAALCAEFLFPGQDGEY